MLAHAGSGSCTPYRWPYLLIAAPNSTHKSPIINTVDSWKPLAFSGGAYPSGFLSLNL